MANNLKFMNLRTFPGKSFVVLQRRYKAIAMGVFALLFFWLNVVPLALAQDYDIDKISRAVVQVKVDDGTGSGSILIRNNEILVITNKHVVEGFTEVNIAVLSDLNAPAELKFKAELKGFSDEYDIAVLRIVSDLEGNLVTAEKLLRGQYGFPFSELTMAASEATARRGEHVGVFGYPGAVENEMVYTTGIISAVQYGEYKGERLPLWYRTNAEISPGNSGGTVVNSRGEFIGIPTYVANQEVTGSRLGSLFAAEFALAIIDNEADLLSDWALATRSDDERLNFSKEPGFGSVSLDSAALAAMHQHEVISGGDINSRYLGGECLGYVASAPDYRMMLTEAQANLFISFVSNEASDDTSLLVNAPNGDWHCNDDYENTSLNPGVVIENAAVGQYDIWVGSYLADRFITGTLGLSNVTVLTAANLTASLDISGVPYYGEASLVRGFTPDPHRVDIMGGGSINIAQTNIENCVGYVSEKPDFRLRWEGASSLLQFYFIAEDSALDPVLVVNAPDGSWYCNDDANSNTRNPSIKFNSARNGVYDIWVGSYQESVWVQGELRITELEARVN
ncbi:trypsin-like serine protease [Idiomarina sp. A28L]|uniref:S1C family serine protease n=1 Tax=Idiomarina sp. A28L TaxID=1036674 RepID=UPI0002138966|nr:serine protease [Idiomarina sp. A28L]EGN76209.1 trypsin-like serine protease [Idiomarina sp. A28L]